MAKSYKERLEEMQNNASLASAIAAYDLDNEPVMVLAEDDGNWTWIENSTYLSTKDKPIGKKYEDTNYSTVDSKKNVSVSPEQVNLTQESESQYIPFEMFRYYDGVDLAGSSMKVTIYFVNKNGDFGESDVINFRYNNEKIRFGWVVPVEATLFAGKLKFEIQVTGTSPLGGKYILKTKPNNDLEILESLQGDGKAIVDEGWATNVLQEVKSSATAASNSAENAKTYAQQAQDAKNEINQKINDASETISANVTALVEKNISENYYDKEETDKAIDNAVGSVDGLANFKSTYDPSTGELSFYNGETLMGEKHTLMTNPTKEWSDNYKETIKIDLITPVDNKVSEHITSSNEKTTEIEGDIKELTGKFEDYYTSTEVDEKLKSIDVSGQFNTLKDEIANEYYKKSETEDRYASKTSLSALENEINSNTLNITEISGSIATINETLSKVNTDPVITYNMTYNDPDDEAENIVKLYEIKNEGKGELETSEVKAQFVITGGSGGSSSSNIIKIDRITPSPYVVTSDDRIEIKYKFTGTDSSGDDIGQGSATWKLGSRIIKTENVYTGENTADLTGLLSIGSDQKLTLIIKDDIGTQQQKSWYVSVIDVKLESDFNDTKKYPANEKVDFTYKPYGAVDKTVHVKMDGNEIGTVVSKKSAAGLSTSYSIPAQAHGTHLVEIYMTAEINDNTIESNHILKDIIFYDADSSVPVISCSQQNFTAKQYEATNIIYTVYDPSTENPSVNLKTTYQTGSETIVEYDTNIVMSSSTETWQFKTDVVGTHILTITCGDTVKTLIATVEELGIEVSPTTTGLAFDFNPVGRSNSDENRVWSDKNTDVNMTVSENFDWVNGGYQIDENGDQYFCVKAGTTATINHKLFNDDAKANGKEFKVVFKTCNVKKRDTSFISCMDSDIGLDMKVEKAYIYSSNGELFHPYCEDDIIEFEFNIKKNESGLPIVLTYEDGTGCRPMIYTEDSSFWQSNPQPIVIGSQFCDVHIYRMKAYSTDLGDKDILNNFIADARNGEEMVDRYNRNQIYKEGSLDAEYLAEMRPDLRVVLIEAPWFTNDKSNKVDNTTVTMIYKGGDPILDNWTCTGAKHSGQGTSSNEYGAASRNMDLIMDGADALFTFSDGSTGKTITLTRDSVPTDYLNIKVNVASTDNANNAQMTMRYNEFNPFKRTVRLKDEKVRDTMEFYNCVVFIRETNPDISTHREFNDCEYHFYDIGNIGDSKKTDDTRVNDKNDPKEFVIEITDYNQPLSEFPTGKEDTEGNKIICPMSEWKEGNEAYDALYADYKYEEGKFKSFGSETYEFRYEMKGISEEQREVNIDAWRAAYKFIATSDDETFVKDFDKYFVKDSILFYYLFTEQYLMVDNRAKNTFIHYGKVWYSTEEANQFKETYGKEIESKYIDDTQAAFNDGYRFDLVFGYDFDTCLGIDNTGKLVLTYGQEDTDFYVDGDPSSAYIYRAAESTLFCRVRDLFPSELQAMYIDRESAGAWSAEGLISQWDEAQNQFPEELWRLMFEREFYRTYQGISVDNSIPGAANPRFLRDMMNGKKKYQRRMFIRNQELYFATKYFGTRATSEQVMMRFNNPVGSIIKPDFTLKITPYSDMYIAYSFAANNKQNIRAKAGRQYTIKYSGDTADITLLYGASFIQEIDDLSRCFIGDNDFTKATRLQKLVLGSSDENYKNTYMTGVSIGNLPMLEYLDVRKITGLNSVINLSGCGNVREIYAEGSGATGVIFANGGKLEKAYLPAITTLTMKNLNYLEDFSIESYGNLTRLVIENTPFVNTYDLVNKATNLGAIRLSGMNWDSTYNIQDTSLFERMYSMRGIDNNNLEIPDSVLAGTAFVAVMKQQALNRFNKKWKNLIFTYNSFIEQYAVTFKNADGTILDIQYVDKGSIPVDPITRDIDPIPVPTKESSVENDFTFDKWDTAFSPVFGDVVITATYISSIREYTVNYVSKGVTLKTVRAKYGTTVFYDGDLPVYTAEEQAYKYYLFSKWDKSGYVDGDKTINAVFDTMQYTSGYYNEKDLSELKPVELYALTRIKGLADELVNAGTLALKDSISFEMGHDFDFDDVETYELVKDCKYVDTGASTVFTGNNYIDTNISIMDKDRSFVLAVDYEFATGNSSNATLMQCFRSNGKDGFKLFYNSTPKIQWGTSSRQSANIGNREMIVLRHVAGETGLHVYLSNMSQTDVGYAELSHTRNTNIDSTLVFGCVKADDGFYENYAKGTVYWAKMWYTDLGDEACKELAGYIHEKMNLEMIGTRRKWLSDVDSTRSTMTFLASHTLRTKMSITNRGDNKGGWADTSLRTWLNSRFYNGLPQYMRLLVKRVKVASSAGDLSEEIIESPNYIYIPSIIEWKHDIERTRKNDDGLSETTTEPFSSEDSPISFITKSSDRIRKDYTDTAVEHITRSPSMSYSTYFYTITATGTANQIGSPGSEYGVVVELNI